MSELKPTAECPKCGTRPAVRLPVSLVDDHAQDPPTRLFQTYQCHRRGCATIYRIEMRHIQQAKAA